MDFRVLGPLEVDAGDGLLPLGGPKQRAVLANLLVRANHVVPADTLIADVWGDEAPEKARNTLQTYVSNLRRTLGDDRLQGRPPGYLLALDSSELDAARFEGLLRSAKRSLTVDPSVTVAAIDDALSLWRGPALADLADQHALLAQAARLDELRLSAQETRIEALMAAGSSATAVAELEPLLAANPLRESFWGLMMLALYREGRQADALSAYRKAHKVLIDELGIEPSRELQKLHGRLLEQDPSLELRGAGLRGYRLLEQIGESPDGVTFRAIQPRVERDVAIKVFNEHIANDAAFAQRFDVEAQAAAAVEHASIVPIYDYWREPGRAYIVSRFLRGGTLSEALSSGKPLAHEEELRLTAQIASALACIHRLGRVHGNVAPTSVLLDQEGNGYLGDPLIGADPGAGPSDDVRALATLVRSLNRSLPRTLREIVDRADGQEALPASAFAYAALAALGPARPVVSEEIRNPFKGLRPFREADADDFYGRTELTGRLIAALNAPGANWRFLALVGPSGCGKSSLLRAGLLPAIRQGALADRPMHIAEMFPGVHPLEELEAALLRIAVRPASTLRNRLEAGSRGLLEAVDALVPEGAELVLIVDQLEELYTITADLQERNAFLELVRVACADPGSRCRVVATLRADFYDRPLLQPRFGELLAARTEAIPPQTPEELEQAIRGPAERAGLMLESGLVAELIADVAHQPGSLPFLQYALTELVEDRQGPAMTSAAYREMGGIAGAVSSRAERIFAASSSTEQLATRQVFLRLVTLGEGREDTRRRVARTELDALDVERRTLDQVVAIFGHHRILTFDREPLTREPTVEIAHEALIAGWGRLRDWIDGAREDLRTERRLSRAATEWRAAGEDPSYLLSGGRLEQAEAWAARTDLAFGRDELSYLKAGVDQRDADLYREEMRRERERRVERTSRRRTRALVVVLAVAALVAVSLTLVAWGQGRRASQEAQIAHARELAAAAEANLGVDPERSILLAVGAVNETRSLDGSVLPEAEAALHDAVTASRAVMTLPGVADNVAWGETVLATADADGAGTIDLRDPLTGDILRRITLRGGELKDLAFSADGSLLLSASSNGLLQVWNPETASLVATVRGDGELTGISSSTRYAAASWPEEETVRVVDLKTGRTAQTFGDTPALSTALSPDGTALAVGTRSTTVVDLASGKAKYPALERHFGAGSVAWSPDGRYLSTSGIAGADIWSAKSGRHLYTLPDSFWTETTAWSADSTRLVTAGSEAKVTVWEIRASGPREQLRLSSAETVGGVASLALSPDDTYLVATSLGDDVAKVWDIGPDGDAEWVNIPTVPEYGDASFMPDGSRVVAADPNGNVRVWSVASGDPTGMAIGPRVEEHAFELSADGRWLTGLGSMATVWNTSTGDAASSIHLPIELGGSNFSADGELLVVNDAQTGHGTTIINRAGQTLATLPDKPGYATVSGQFSPDGRLVATIGEKSESESLVTLWDWRAMQVVRLIETPHAQGLVFDPAGRRLATAWGKPAVWDVESGTEAMTLEGDIQYVDDVAFSPDGSRLAAASGDRTIRIFDASTGGFEFSLAGSQRFPIGRIAFSSDGTKLASQGPLEGVVRVWALDVRDLLYLAEQNLTRSVTADECSRYPYLDSCSR